MHQAKLLRALKWAKPTLRHQGGKGKGKGKGRNKNQKRSLRLATVDPYGGSLEEDKPTTERKKPRVCFNCGGQAQHSHVVVFA